MSHVCGIEPYQRSNAKRRNRAPPRSALDCELRNAQNIRQLLSVHRMTDICNARCKPHALGSDKLVYVKKSSKLEDREQTLFVQPRKWDCLCSRIICAMQTQPSENCFNKKCSSLLLLYRPFGVPSLGCPKGLFCVLKLTCRGKLSPR
jgi:hypothetical protein